MEFWIDAADFPNYEVSNCGRIRNKRNGRILKPNKDRYGYERLSIGNTDNVYIHRVVTKSFYGPPPDEEHNCVNHINCDRADNHVFNLQWVSPRENVKWAILKGNLDPFSALEKANEANRKKRLEKEYKKGVIE